MVQQSLFSVVNGEITRERRCTACPLGLDPRLQSNCMQGLGEKEPLLMFVGVSPGWEDDRTGIPYTGPTGAIFKELLIDAGIKYSEVYITNAVKCASDNPKEVHFRKCREHLIREIQEIRPKALVAIGGQAHSQLIGRAVPKIRQKEFSCILVPGLKVYAIQQPAILFHQEPGPAQERAYAELVEDLTWIKQQALSGGKSMRPQDYRMAKTLSEVDAFLAELEQPNALSFDFETNNYLGRPHKELGHDIVAAGFSKGQGHGRIIPVRMKAIKTPLWWDDDTEQKVRERLRNFFLSKQTFFGHNAYRYDTLVARGCLDVERIKLDFDTMLAQYCLDEEPPHDLEHVALRYTPFDKLWKEKFNLEDPYKLAEYLYMDVDATSQIREAIEPQLVDGLRELLDNILMPTGRVLTDMQWRGVKVDRDALKLLKAQLGEKKGEILQKIKRLDAVKRWEIHANRHFNPASPAQVGEIMEKVLGLPKIKETDSGGYSTDDSVMEKYKDREFCSLLLDYRGLDKLDGTYVAGLIDVLSPESFAHTSYNIITKTGRGSSSEPNLQNLPRKETAKDFPIKKAFVPRSKTRCFVQWDYSQAELRVWASLSNDQKLIHAYQNNIDVHRSTAADAYGKKPEEVTAEERTAAKCFHPDTEVLTRDGWKKIADLSFSDYVLQAHPKDEFRVDFSWTHPTGIQRLRHPSGTLCRLKNEGIDLRVTNDHRMLGWTGCKKPRDYSPKAFASRAAFGWAGAGLLNDSYWLGEVPSEQLLRVAVATQADGSISPYGGISFNFSKERKVERLKQLLLDASIPYSFSLKNNGTYYFGIRAGDAQKISGLLTNKAFDWRLLALPLRLRQVIVEETEFWDATRVRRAIQYYSSNRQNIDVLQALAVSVGRKARCAPPTKGYGNRQDAWLLSIKDRPHCGSSRMDFTEYPYDGEVVCLSVPSSYVLVRDGGIPVITGQCVNFGVIYGKQEETLVRDFVEIAEAKARNDGRRISRTERADAENRARVFFRKHQETFVDGWAWLRKQMEIVVTTGVQTLPSGRRRRHRKSDHSAQREGVNFPIQSLANEVCFAALREMDEKLPTIRGADACLVLTVHDSIVAECEQEFFWDVAQLGYDVMTGVKFDWMRVPMEVDVEYGVNYGDLQKLDLKTRTVKN